MSRTLAIIWAFLGSRPRVYFGLVLMLEALLALAIGSRMPLDVAFAQFMLGAEQIVATHHIQSTFLPIGYAALIGYAEVAGSVFGRGGPAAAIFVMQVGLLLLVVALVRTLLRGYTSARFATTAAFLIALDPALLYNVKRISDANLTLTVLLGFLVSLLVLRRAPSGWHACLCGAALACGVLVRPNLGLMILLLFWAVRGLPWGRWLGLWSIAAATTLVVYGAVTGAVHGRPFYPQNGPYNIYAGYNVSTEAALLHLLNGEQSILPAMADLGMHPRLDWYSQSDVPGVDDARDERYIPFYKAQAGAFLRQHPGESVWLVLVKFATFLRPVHDNIDHKSGLFQEVRLVIKTSTLVVVLGWVGLLVYSRLKRLELGSGLVIWTTILYALPFVLINADPRFRIAYEGVILTDLARMLYLLHTRRTVGRRVHLAEGVSL